MHNIILNIFGKKNILEKLQHGDAQIPKTINYHPFFKLLQFAYVNQNCITFFLNHTNALVVIFKQNNLHYSKIRVVCVFSVINGNSLCHFL